MKAITNFFNPTQWLYLAIALGVLLTMFGGAATAIHVNGKASGRAEVEAKWDKERVKLLAEKVEQGAALNRSLLIQAERVATLSNTLQENVRAHSKVSNDLAVLRTRAAADSERLRKQANSAQLAARVANAERAVVNTFAARSFAAATACRNDLAEIGLGVGGLVEASASAHYEHGRAEALIDFHMPQAPTPPTAPVF